MKSRNKICISILLIMTVLANCVPAVSAANCKNTDNTISEAQMLECIDIEELHADIVTYIEKHPEATEKKINDYVLKTIRNMYEVSCEEGEASTRSITYYGYTLNDAEEELFYENPWKAINSCYYGLVATNGTIDVFGYNRADDASDAYRHTYWNALMTRHIDYTWASRWATAHEYGHSGLSTTMDLWNNAKGRGIGADYPSASDSYLSSKVIVALNSGNQLKKIVNDVLVYTYNEI